MRKELRPTLALICIACSVTARTSPAGRQLQVAASAERPGSVSASPTRMSTILYGVAYYPEYMPYERLDADVAVMRKAWLSVVRVGESTWSSCERRDGDSPSTW